MSAKHQKIDIDIPDNLRPAARERLAEVVIDYIVQRSEQGLDKNGKPFPGYSEEYIKSLDFKIGGKSPGDVDLTLSGDMLASIMLLKHGRGKLTIGFEKGSEENARADGNIRGTYGQDRPIRGKRRDFLGIRKRELNNLIREVAEEFGGDESTSVRDIAGAVLAAALTRRGARATPSRRERRNIFEEDDF